MRSLYVSLQVAGLLLAAGPLSAQQTPAARSESPSVEIAASITSMARVDAIDMSTREVTLRKEDGEIVTLVAGPDIQRLAEIEVGDVVVARYDVGFIVGFGPPGSEPTLIEETEIVRAPQSERPGGVARSLVAVTATIVEIDSERRIVTLRGPQRTIALPVDDSVDLSKVSVGDRIGAAYEESIALQVSKVEE